MFAAEDGSGSILHYPNCKGTKTIQFEHTYRPFLNRLKKDEELSKIHREGVCRMRHDNELDYLTQFVNAYKGSPKFSLSWYVWLTHDDTKDLYPSDYAIYNFYLKNRDALNNSFIFFFGDHGPRLGK
ncbi:hypothetical protein GCK32_018630, partial [Trichostrongylus colubriformis]